MKPSITRLLKAPLAQVPQYINSSRMDLPALECDLHDLVQRAVLIAEYIGTRYNTGTGEKSHEKAAERANRTLTKVRKAMGFTYPEKHETL